MNRKVYNKKNQCHFFYNWPFPSLFLFLYCMTVFTGRQNVTHAHAHIRTHTYTLLTPEREPRYLGERICFNWDAYRSRGEGLLKGAERSPKQMHGCKAHPTQDSWKLQTRSSPHAFQAAPCAQQRTCSTILMVQAYFVWHDALRCSPMLSGPLILLQTAGQRSLLQQLRCSASCPSSVFCSCHFGKGPS